MEKWKGRADGEIDTYIDRDRPAAGAFAHQGRLNDA